MQPKVSIIIPVYNVKQYLKECVDSATGQTYKDIEILLVDDGSTDGSGLLCDELAKADERIQVFHKENGGLSEARNYGMDRAEGTFLYFLDSDDFIEPYTIETLTNEAVRNAADVVLFDARVIDQDGRAQLEKDAYMFYYRIGDYTACQSGKELFSKMLGNKEYRSAVPLLFIRKEALKYRFAPILHEDELFTIQLLYSVSRVLHYPEELYVRRVRSSSITTMKKKPAHYLGIKRVIMELDKVPGFDAAVVRRICSFYKKQQSVYDALSGQDKKKVYRDKQELNDFIVKKSFWGNKKLRVYYYIYCCPLFSLIKRIMPKKVRAKIEIKVKRLVEKWKKYKNYKNKLEQIKQTDQKHRIFMIGTPVHGNLGDHAIAIAEEHFIGEVLPGWSYIEIEMPFYKSCKKQIRKIIRPKDLVIISGGGWMGNQWFHNEKVVREVVRTYQDNAVVIFPQTIYYELSKKRDKQIEKAKRIYSSHEKLVICLRDEASFSFAQNHGFKRCIYVPDIALYEKRDSYGLPRSNILLCKRSDREKYITDETWNEIEQFLKRKDERYKETTTVIGSVSPQNRKTAFDKKLLEFSRAKLVITDRLHAMIFAAITATPCVAFDNTSRKVSGVYFWLQELPYIRCVKDAEQAKKEIAGLLDQRNEVWRYKKPDFTRLREELISLAGDRNQAE